MTVPCPRIVVHESADAPPAHRFLASFYVGGERLPVVFTSDDKDTAIAMAADWWARQQALQARKASHNAARSARMRKRAA